MRRFLFRHVFCFLAGATLHDWLKLLAREGFAVAPRYWPRAAFITAGTLPNAWNRWRESCKYGAAIDKTVIQPPLFILGHWRHGTTHLHNLLALDEQFAYPNLYDVCYPHAVVCGQRLLSKAAALATPRRRLQDSIELDGNTPQEDETALCLTTFLSPFMGWVFPRRYAHYERYLTFRDVPPQEVQLWKEAFPHYLRKLTWKYQRPLVLKSPPHTCRVKLLLELFPDARFIHIQRNPYAVYSSAVYLEKSAILGMHLQKPSWETLEDRIIERYKTMYDVFFEERNLIPREHYHEIRFEALERQPVEQIRLAYERLNLPDFECLVPRLERYLGSLKTFEKNSHPELSARATDRIARAWDRSFEEWGYSR